MQNTKLVFKQWIAAQLGSHDFDLNALVGDASFRAYYRVVFGERRYIAMLAPPEQENTDSFVAIAHSWRKQGILVPNVWAWEPEQGFVLLSDFGDTLLLDCLDAQNVASFYQQALQALVQIQQSEDVACPLPLFDEAHTLRELSYFDEWFLAKLLNIDLHPSHKALLNDVQQYLLKALQAQPQVPIHRDYHARNLMVLPQGQLGIIDFQDAMIGPITYDLVSILKDCYIVWPNNLRENWVRDFYQQQTHLKDVSLATVMKWFDLTGLQRHLKVLGVFARLKIRDGKARYLSDIPRVLDYVLEITEKYPELQAFDRFLNDEVVNLLAPALNTHIESQEIKVA